MAAAEDRHQQLIEDLFLPDDDLADFLAQLLVGVAQLLKHLGVSASAMWENSRDGVGTPQGWERWDLYTRHGVCLANVNKS